MLSRFDELVAMRQKLTSWWSLRSTVAQYNRKIHSLRVDVTAPTMIAFCGQQYAGAKNYHDAPDFFFEDVRKELQSNTEAITEAAYARKLASLDDEISSMRSAVEAQLAMSGTTQQ